MSQIIVGSGVTTSVTSATTSQYVVQSGGTLIDKTGGSLTSTLVQTSGTFIVSSGTETSATISAGGVETISAGGASSDTVFGTVDLFGGSASNETVSAGGLFQISGGNTATNVTLVGGATLELETAKSTVAGSVSLSGGGNTIDLTKVISATGTNGAVITGFTTTDRIFIGGALTGNSLTYVTGASNTSVTLDTTSAGSAVTQTFVFSGTAGANAFDIISGSFGVYSGSTSGSYAGVEIVSGGGQTISTGQTLVVQSGGSVSGETASSGGTLLLSGSNATASNTTLTSGGTVTLATSTTALTGTLTLTGGGNVINVSSLASAGAGDQAVIGGLGLTDKIDIAPIASAGASLSFATSGGNEVVTVSGAAGSESFIFSGTTVYNAATMALVQDGSGVDLVYDAGQITVSSATSSGAYTVSSGVALVVSSGGSVTGTTVLNGGNLNVRGGADVGATISAGGSEVVSAGSASGDQILGAVTVASGAMVGAETVSAGGSLTVGGTDSGSTVLSNGSELVAGQASGTQIYGSVTVSAGLLASAAIHSGGVATLAAGAVDSGATVSAGGEIVASASTGSASLTGDAIYGTISSYSGLAGSYTSETVYSGGELFLANSNNATSTTVSSGGTLVLSGKETATGVTLAGGAEVLLDSPKATLAGSLVFAGGGNTVVIGSGASLTSGLGDTAVASGFSNTDKFDILSSAISASAGVVVSATLSSTISGGNTVATVVSNGAAFEVVTFSGTALNGDLDLLGDGSGGYELVNLTPFSSSVSGATSAGAYLIGAGSTVTVVSGGSVSAPTVLVSGSLIVDGGQEAGASVQAGATETVSAGTATSDQIAGTLIGLGGSIVGPTISSGGLLNLSSGGTASNITLDGGAEAELTDATATLAGTVTIANGFNTLLVSATPNAGAGDQAAITGYQTNDKIEIAGIAYSGAMLSFSAGYGGSEIATVSGGGQSVSFTFANGGADNASTMSLAPDGSGVDLVLDTTPAISFTTLNNLTTNQTSATINGFVNVSTDPYAIGQSVDVLEGATVVGSATVASTGYWSATVDFPNADGSNTLTASVTDKAGNAGTTASSITYTSAPGTPVFLPGSLVISISGDGDGSGSYGDNAASPAVLEDVNASTGAIYSQLVLPQTASGSNSAFSSEYGSSSEGTLQLAANGQSIVIAGYGVNAATFNAGGNAVYGSLGALAQTYTVEPSGDSYTLVPRVVADINADGAVDTSTALLGIYNTNNPRSVTTVDGTTFYLSGQGAKDPTQGVWTAADGATGTSATNISSWSDTRDIEIYNGDLYISSDSKQGAEGIYDLGPVSAAGSLNLGSSSLASYGLPGLTGTVTLNGSNGNSINGSSGSVYLSPENFFFASSTVLYVADGGAPKNGGLGDGGLQKWTYNSTTSQWQLAYTLTSGLNLVADTNAHGSSGLIGLTGQVNGDGTVTLYATNETLFDLDQTALYSITDTLADTTAAQASSESFTTLVTASAGENIRGVALAPTDPTATITALVGQPLSGGTVELQGTGVAGDAVTLYVGGSTAVGSGTVTTSGTFDVITSASFGDGAHAFTATLTDSSGVASQPSAPFTVDVDPAAPGLSGPTTAPVSGGDITLSGTGATGETITVTSGGVTLGSATVASGAWSLDLGSGFADGSYLFSATQTDGSGFTGPAASTSVSVDPGAPTVTGFVGHPGSGGTVELLGLGEAGASITLFDGDGHVAGSGFADSAGHFDITTSETFADRYQTFTAQQTDSAGLTGPASSAFVLPVTPAAPAIGAQIGTTISGGTIEVTGTGQPGDTVVLRMAGTVVVGSAMVGSGGLFDLVTSSTFTDGVKSLTATQTDGSGLQSPASPVFSAAVLPPAPAITGVSGDLVGGGALTVTGTGKPGDEVAIFADGGSVAVGSGTVTSNGTFSVASTPLTAGSHSFTAAQTDSASLTGPASAPFAVSVSEPAPTLTALVGEVSSGWTIAVQGTGVAGDVVSLFSGTSQIGPTATVGSNGAFTITTTTTAKPGVLQLSVSEKNGAGASSAKSAPVAITVGARNVYTLSPLAETIQGQGGAGTVTIASPADLLAADVIALNSGSADPTGVLKITGGGTFDLATPATLSGVTTIDVTPGSGTAEPTVGMRNGLNATVVVLATSALGAGAVIDGADDTATFRLTGGADTVVLGAAGETVSGGSGADTVVATAATAEAKIVGGGGGVTLQIQGGGTATLNTADRKLAVVLEQATSLAIGPSITTVSGSAGDDTVTLTAASLTPVAKLDGGGGSNTLVLSGSGAFNLGKPATVANFQTLDVSAGQTVTLRAGQSQTVVVTDPTVTAGASLIGAADSDAFDLGEGPDTVTLGSSTETVVGGAGAGVVVAKSAPFADARLTGGAGGLTLKITTAGTTALNAADSGLTEVDLTAAGAYTLTANGQSGLLVKDLGAGASTITLDGAGQKLEGTIASVGGDSVGGLTGTDAIDITNLAATGLVGTFAENTAGTAGVLTLKGSGHTVALTLLGQYANAGFSGSAAAAGFSLASDGSTGVAITHPTAIAPPGH